MQIDNQPIKARNGEMKERHAARNAHAKPSLIPAEEIRALEDAWRNDSRWRGVIRNYVPEQVLRLRGTVKIEHTIADRMSRKLWRLLNQQPYLNALGAVTGNQAVQMAQAGLKAIYMSGWQVAADNNLSASMYPDQSLYPSNSVPLAVRRINKALQRADQIQWLRGEDKFDMWAAFEFIQKLTAARLAADVAGVPMVLVARTDADSAKLLTSDFDERDKPFLTGERTEEGFFRIRSGIELAIARALAYAPYADLVWCETSTPDLHYAREFAEAIKRVHPDKLLAYNCSPSFNWRENLDDRTIAHFQNELGAMGYKFQFVTLAGFHALNLSMWELAREYKERQMAAYTELQEREFAAELDGYGAVKHQSYVGAGYFDEITSICGAASTLALKDSTEEAQV